MQSNANKDSKKSAIDTTQPTFDKANVGTTAFYNTKDKDSNPTNDRERDQETWNENEVKNKDKMYAKNSEIKKGINKTNSNREETDEEENIE